MVRATVTVDGLLRTDKVEPRMLLVHYLRDRLGRTGTTIGCDTRTCTPERVWRAIHEGSSGGDPAAAGTVAYGGTSTSTTAGEAG